MLPIDVTAWFRCAYCGRWHAPWWKNVPAPTCVSRKERFEQDFLRYMVKPDGD